MVAKKSLFIAAFVLLSLGLAQAQDPLRRGDTLGNEGHNDGATAQHQQRGILSQDLDGLGQRLWH